MEEQGIPVVRMPADWTGKCVVCGGKMTATDFREQNGVMAVEYGVCCHARHVLEDYDGTVKAFAHAIVEAMKCQNPERN